MGLPLMGGQWAESPTRQLNGALHSHWGLVPLALVGELAERLEKLKARGGPCPVLGIPLITTPGNDLPRSHGAPRLCVLSSWLQTHRPRGPAFPQTVVSPDLSVSPAPLYSLTLRIKGGDEAGGEVSMCLGTLRWKLLRHRVDHTRRGPGRSGLGFGGDMGGGWRA